ncbi:MAG: helix-turn-helix domain-containing protein [Bdellovibrionales bacterium]
MHLVLCADGIHHHFIMGRRRYDIQKAKKSLGLKLREIREKKGWTLEATEEHGWGNWRTLQAIESGQNVKLGTLIRLANLYGVHPSDLLKDL